MFVSMGTFNNIAGLSNSNPIALFIVYMIFSAAFVVIYVIFQVVLVLNTLDDRWPLGTFKSRLHLKSNHEKAIYSLASCSSSSAKSSNTSSRIKSVKWPNITSMACSLASSVHCWVSWWSTNIGTRLQEKILSFQLGVRVMSGKWRVRCYPMMHWTTSRALIDANTCCYSSFNEGNLYFILNILHACVVETLVGFITGASWCTRKKLTTMGV